MKHAMALVLMTNLRPFEFHMPDAVGGGRWAGARAILTVAGLIDETLAELRKSSNSAFWPPDEVKAQVAAALRRLAEGRDTRQFEDRVLAGEQTLGSYFDQEAQSVARPYEKELPSWTAQKSRDAVEGIDRVIEQAKDQLLEATGA